MKSERAVNVPCLRHEQTTRDSEERPVCRKPVCKDPCIGIVKNSQRIDPEVITLFPWALQQHM